jgi:hypothetical protein
MFKHQLAIKVLLCPGGVLSTLPLVPAVSMAVAVAVAMAVTVAVAVTVPMAAGNLYDA